MIPFTLWFAVIWSAAIDGAFQAGTNRRSAGAYH
jgi:hypothetical protein